MDEYLHPPVSPFAAHKKSAHKGELLHQGLWAIGLFPALNMFGEMPVDLLPTNRDRLSLNAESEILPDFGAKWDFGQYVVRSIVF